MALSSRRSDIQTKLSLEFMAAVKQREIEECSNVPVCRAQSKVHRWQLAWQFFGRTVHKYRSVADHAPLSSTSVTLPSDSRDEC